MPQLQNFFQKCQWAHHPHTRCYFCAESDILGPSHSRDIHRESKNQDTQTLQNINRFSKFFSPLVLSTKFATTWSLHIPPHLKDIAALPCETVMFQLLASSAANILLKRNVNGVNWSSQSPTNATVRANVRSVHLWLEHQRGDVYATGWRRRR